jgi:plasmid stability protein
MAHLVLHDVDPKVIEELLRRADPHGRTIEDEAKTVLEEALGLSSARSLQAAQRIRAELAGAGGLFGDSADVLRQERDR